MMQPFDNYYVDYNGLLFIFNGLLSITLPINDNFEAPTKGP